MVLSYNIETKELVGYALTLLTGLLVSVWGLIKWLLSGVHAKLKKIDELDGTVTALKPKLEDLLTQLTSLSGAMAAFETRLTAFDTRITQSINDIEGNLDRAVKDINKRLEAGNDRFQEHDLKIEKSKRELLETLIKATTEARNYHDQANEDFVRKEDLEDKIRSTAGRYCNENCRDRKR